MSTPVRTRAARKSPAERSAEIAEAARLLALEQGLTAVTLRAIAARAGVAPALVAHYQPSMDALVADYVKRPPEQIDWDVPLAGYGLDELDASEVLMIVEEQLDLEIRNRDLETLLGSSAVNGLHQRLTTGALARLVEMGRAAAKSAASASEPSALP